MGMRLWIVALLIAGLAAVGVANQGALLQWLHPAGKAASTASTAPEQRVSPETAAVNTVPAVEEQVDEREQEESSHQTAADNPVVPAADEPPAEEERDGEVVMVSNVQDVMVVVNKQRELPPDYVPPDLVVPNIPFSFSGDDPKKQVRAEVAKALEELFAAAAAEQIELAGVSGYRSYARQQAIFNWNAQQQGVEEANKTSAIPGQSEHQTGLAMDVSSPSVGYALVEAFGDTKEGKWLAENAPRFGFIIRYPKGKEAITGYSYEPWHLRYVGVQAAQEISEAGITLEEYLGLAGGDGRKTKG